MLTVVDYELIRRKHFVDGLSGRAIAKELGHSRKTVAKALANAAPPGYRLSAPRRRLDLAHRPELAAVGEGIRPAGLYDQLAQQGEEVAA